MPASLRLGLGLAVGLSLVSGAYASTGQLVVDYSFERPTISCVEIGGLVYHRVTIPAAPNGGNAGQPALPAGPARLLLPFGCEVSSVEIVPDDPIMLGAGYVVEPVAPPAELSQETEGIDPASPNGLIYTSNRPFPGTLFENIGIQGFRGYQIVVLQLHPVQYAPASGELYYYPRLTVVVNTIEAGRSSSLLRSLAADEAEVRDKVDNPDTVKTYGVVGGRDGRHCDLLILTTPSLAMAFQALKDYHDAHGLFTEIHTTADVGSNDPDAIRNYIRDRFLNEGISYVLIGGDDDLIPAKKLYVASWSGGDVEYAMPADMYFGCLDGTYNYDGDTYWGEPNDGQGGGDVDMVAEVYVGRAPVDNATEATRFVNKTIWYLGTQHSRPANVLLVDEYLGFGGCAEYAGDTLDQLVGSSSADGYTTAGIPSYPYFIDKLYDRDWPGHDWPQSEVVSRINGGVHLLDHLGHGTADCAMKMYSSDVTAKLTNSDLCFVYSQTCDAGAFDLGDCWAEAISVKTSHGAFAAIMNARSGWGAYNSTDGASQRFNRAFWDEVFNPVSNERELGPAAQKSKEDNLYRINQDCMRWCTYELNLFGDPTVALCDVTGLVVTPRSEFAPAGPVGGPFAPGGVTYTVENLGLTSINYSVTATPAWVTVSNGSGVLNVGGSANVTVSVDADADGLSTGRYDGILYFYNTTNHVGDATVRLVLRVGAPELAYQWSMDTDPGWVAGGQWAWGQPTGGGGERGWPDPTSGYTGSKVYGCNLNGDYENNLPETHLTSAVFDCRGLADVKLKFHRWLGVDGPAADHAYFRVSNNGLKWTTLWQNSSQITDSSWSLQQVDISSVTDNQQRVYLRWTMGATDGSGAFCGWNIDDVEVWALPFAGPLGACCLTGACSVTPQSGCGGAWMGAGTGCYPNPCPQPSGACCQPTGTCSVAPQASCQGTWMGAGTGCSPNPCPQPTGACCYYYGTCGARTAAECQANQGTYQGNFTTCTPKPCPPPAVCRGDGNCDLAINWRDLDYFVAAMCNDTAAWEGMFGPESPICPFENNDVNGDGVVNWRDIDPLVSKLNTTCQ